MRSPVILNMLLQAGLKYLGVIFLKRTTFLINNVKTYFKISWKRNMFFHLMLKELEFGRILGSLLRHGISTWDVTNDIRNVSKWNIPSSALTHVSQLARSSCVCSVSPQPPKWEHHAQASSQEPALDNFVSIFWKCMTEWDGQKCDGERYQQCDSWTPAHRHSSFYRHMEVAQNLIQKPSVSTQWL